LKRRKVVLSLEQADIEDVLEELDLSAQRRLGHVEPRRGAPEVQLLRDGDKAAHLAQLEHWCPRRNVHLPGGPVWSTCTGQTSQAARGWQVAVPTCAAASADALGGLRRDHRDPRRDVPFGVIASADPLGIERLHGDHT